LKSPTRFATFETLRPDLPQSGESSDFASTSRGPSGWLVAAGA
jgi:hypothetical protein